MPTVKKIWRKTEDLLFIGFACSIMYVTVDAFVNGSVKSFFGMGYLKDLTDPVQKKNYYQSVMTILSILTTFFLLVEMIRLFIKSGVLKNIKENLPALNATNPGTSINNKIHIFWNAIGQTTFVREFFRRYKSNFLAKVFNEYLSKLIIIFVYIEMMQYFQHFALFTVDRSWIGWLYAYLMWELTYWIWHYSAHRVRLFWCLHSPHHAPAEMNMTVAWVHFFAEGYYTAAIQVPLLMIFGVQPEMVAIILVIDGTWGTFIHAGEDAFKNGKLWILEKFLITPSHHRVHHAKNPLYMDTNFCVLLPFWDWVFGTLQNEKDEVKIEYGITREMDVTNFIDFYFGECISLYRDVASTPGLSNKIRLLFMPPGWSPESREKTAVMVRQKFLEGQEYLGKTSRDLLLEKIKSAREVN